MTLPVAKSCHKMGCELSARCAIYKAEKAQLQIIPQYCGFRCDFYTAKEQSPHASAAESGCFDATVASAPSGDFYEDPDLHRLAGCLR